MEQPINKSTRNYRLIENPDLFIAGLTGSGKTTIANYIIEYYNYLPLRNAGTIKQILCERYNVSPEELEKMKRENPEIRDAHHEVSAYLTKQATINRCNLIAKRESFEFEYNKNTEQNILVHDTRDIEESTVYLENDFLGIFLSRTANVYVQGNHWTDNNMFLNGDIIKLSHTSDYASRMVLVINDGSVSDNFYEEIHPDVKIIKFEKENVTAEQLLEKVDEFLMDLIEKSDE